ncbi:MAG TPA: hypothetical protein VJ957_00985, partial [Longimicrobiales bacterium]|nr:hypothetical protein [Longimicrobiales bacterium]
FARQIAEQVAAVQAEPAGGETADVEALLVQAWVREPSVTVGQRVQEASAKFGEAVKVRRLARFDLMELTSAEAPESEV